MLFEVTLKNLLIAYTSDLQSSLCLRYRQSLLNPFFRLTSGNSKESEETTPTRRQLPGVKRMEIETFGGFSLSFRFTETEADC